MALESSAYVAQCLCCIVHTSQSARVALNTCSSIPVYFRIHSRDRLLACLRQRMLHYKLERRDSESSKIKFLPKPSSETDGVSVCMDRLFLPKKHCLPENIVDFLQQLYREIDGVDSVFGREPNFLISVPRSVALFDVFGFFGRKIDKNI